jgi:hypothetical protein
VGTVGRHDEHADRGEISHPVIKGNDLIHHYKLIEGTMPKAGGPPRCSLIGSVWAVVWVPVFTASGPAPAGLVLTN